MTNSAAARSMITLLVAVLISMPAKADFADGARAYDGGDYAAAYGEWRALAETGNAAAQVALAGLYRDGMGRPVNLARAAHWYRRAANAGNAVAQMNLGEMYQHGWGLARDAIKAYVWYDRAARQGRDWAARQRDALARDMTTAELSAARQELSQSN